MVSIMSRFKPARIGPAPPEKFFDRKIKRLYAAYSQQDFSVRFDGRKLKNRQCVAMSISALAYMAIGQDMPPEKWTATDLYKILVAGNDYYAATLDYVAEELKQIKKLRHDDYCLCASQIKSTGSFFGNDVIVQTGKVELYGKILQCEPESEPLFCDLKTFFDIYNTGIILSELKARGIFRVDNKFYIFDPHAVKPYDKAVLIENDNIEGLFHNFLLLLETENPFYELFPVTVKLAPQEASQNGKDERKEHLLQGKQKASSDVLNKGSSNFQQHSSGPSSSYALAGVTEEKQSRKRSVKLVTEESVDGGYKAEDNQKSSSTDATNPVFATLPAKKRKQSPSKIAKTTQTPATFDQEELGLPSTSAVAPRPAVFLCCICMDEFKVQSDVDQHVQLVHSKPRIEVESCVSQCDLRRDERESDWPTPELNGTDTDSDEEMQTEEVAQNVAGAAEGDLTTDESLEVNEQLPEQPEGGQVDLEREPDAQQEDDYDSDVVLISSESEESQSSPELILLDSD